MNTGLILLGFVFLINPEIMMLDILPDFIGYLLIAVGFRKLSRIDGDFADSKKYAFYLFVFGTVKFIASLSIFGTSIQTNKLTFQFLFCIVELLLGFLLTKSIVHGTDMLAMRPFGNALISGFGDFKLFMNLFFPVKIVFSLFPQLIVLFYPDIDADPTKVVDFVKMKSSYLFVRNASIVICGIFILVFGIYAIGVFSSYIKKSKKDKAFSDGVKNLYGEMYLNNHARRDYLSISSALKISVIGFVFLVSFYIDNVAVFPHAILVFSMYYAIKNLNFVLRSKNTKEVMTVFFMGILSSAIFILQTVLAIIYQKDYQTKFVETPLGILICTVYELISVITVWIFFVKVLKMSKNYPVGDLKKYILALPIICSVVSALSLVLYIFNFDNAVMIISMWLLYVAALITSKYVFDEYRSRVKKQSEL